MYSPQCKEHDTLRPQCTLTSAYHELYDLSLLSEHGEYGRRTCLPVVDASWRHPNFDLKLNSDLNQSHQQTQYQHVPHNGSQYS